MVKDLGEEVLLRIFSKLNNSTLKQCQKVCRAWYAPAHITLLKEVCLWDANIQRFIASIDSNPKPKYLNAVKTIAVINKNDEQPRRRNQPAPSQIRVDLHKLFFRFPNLENISVRGHLYFFDSFNDATCRTFLQSCPKLKMFELPYINKLDKNQYHQTLYKLRTLLSSIALEFIGPASTFSASPPTFPRVKKLIRIGSLSEALPVLNQLPALEAIYSDGSPDYHLDSRLESKSKAEKDKLTKALSQIKELVFQTNRGLHSTTKDFIKKYFTGLVTFKLICPYLEENYGEAQHEAYFTDAMLDLVGSAKQKGQIIMNDFAIDDDYLEIILDQVFKKDTVKRILRLEMVDDDSVDIRRKGCGFEPLTVFGTVNVELKQHERKVTLRFTESDDASRLFGRVSLDDYIDEVEFYSPGSRHSPTYRQSDIDECKEMLHSMSSAKKATLEYGNTVVQLDVDDSDDLSLDDFVANTMLKLMRGKFDML